MKTHESLLYILRHVWFWPIEFGLHPLRVIDRFQKTEMAESEFFAALIGSGLWGALIGTLLWLTNGNIHSIWGTAIAFAGAGAGASAGTGAVAVAGVGAVAGAVSVAGAVVGAGAGSVAVAGAVAVAGTVAVVGARAVAGVGAVAYIFLVFAMGITLGLWLDLIIFENFTAILGVIQLIALIIISAHPQSKLGKISFVITWLIGLPIVGFAFFPLTATGQTPIWGIALSFSFGIGLIAGFFGVSSKGLWIAKKNHNIRLKKTSQESLLGLFYGLFLILALELWLSALLTSDELAQKFNTLAVFLALAPFVWTGLVVYPLMALMALWQYRYSQVKKYRLKKFSLTIPFLWQSFAYPLPKLRHYLFQLAKQHDANTALEAIQLVQLRTLQMTASRQAAQDLAKHPETAFAFCGEVAIRTNIVTLLPFSITGSVGRAIAILAKQQELEYEQPLRVWVDNFSPTRLFGIWRISEPKQLDWLANFQKTRHSALSVRLEYALSTLENSQNYRGLTAYRALLESWLQYAQIKHLDDMLSVAKQSFSVFPDAPQWMQGGWTILQDLTHQLADFNSYRQLTSIEARQQYLMQLHNQLRTLEWQDLPNYWAAIGKELAAEWIAILEKEKRQARQVQEHLHLELELLQDSFLLGKQPINVRVHNPTSLIAKNLYLRMQETQCVFWCHEGIKHQRLEGGTGTDLLLECQINTPGHYAIRGQLTAQDLNGNLFQQAFDFNITVADKGRAYTIPDYQPDVVGNELSDDSTFVGRTDLLAWLASLWRQPESQLTAVLVGQPGIGKTCLLHRIERVGLEHTQLVPIFIPTQSVSNDHAFLTKTYNTMAAAIGVERSSLDSAEPYEEFKRFLVDAKLQLKNRRFLWMLDEADLILERQLGERMPGFLQSLMLLPTYPTVFLFCGSYALERSAWDSSSIFNSAQFKAVSYLSAPESAELLQKTAPDILEFDDYVLGQAYILTRGHPLLLQNLGTILIDEFNAIVRSGKERRREVNLKDLEDAAQVLVQQDNAAFLEPWKYCDVKTQRVLSAIASATDEFYQPQSDMDGILSAGHQKFLDLPRQQIVDIVQRLVDEQILETSGPAYRFAVPLYRRWIYCTRA